jgi:hypothetical protein
MITGIATSATQQSGATVEINQNMDKIEQLGKESAVSAQESAKACYDLSALASELQTLVSNFKLAESSDPASHARKGPRHAPLHRRAQPTDKPYGIGAAAGQ